MRRSCLRQRPGRGIGLRIGGLAMGLGAALAFAAPSAHASPLRVQTTLSHLHLLHRAIASQETNTGQTPKNETQLGVVAQLYAPPVPLVQGVPVDAWGNRFVFRPTEGSGEHPYLLYSIGKNGVDDAGQADDIVSRDALDPKLYPELFEPALQLLPFLLFVIFGPVLWSVIRASKRAAS